MARRPNLKSQKASRTVSKDGKDGVSGAPIVILGAGPAGLACALRILERSKKQVIVIDKSPFVGGAGGSFKWKGHTLDYGPHAFHTRGGEPEDMVRNLFKADPSLLVEGRKQVHVYLRGKRFRYPLQVSEALLKFNPFLSARIILQFLVTSVFHALVSIPIENFENWGRKRFGATLYRMSFGDYTEKVWKTRADKISEKFASEKIQGFSFINLIKRLLRMGGAVTEPYYQTWIYHKFGSGKVYEEIGRKIESLGGKILLGCNVKSIGTSAGRVESIEIECQGVTTRIACEALVNSIPLPHFISLFGENIPFSVRHSASNLRYISLIVVYLEFEMEKATDDHWFYLLDKKFRFNRVSEQKNLSPFTMEPGKTVISLELTCRVGDDLWQLSDKDLVEVAIEDLRGIHFMEDKLGSVSDHLIKRVPNVYEIYYKEFDHHAGFLLSYLQQFENIVTMGRRGLFLQGDQHQSVEMGLKVGNALAEHALDSSFVSEYYRQYVKYIDNYVDFAPPVRKPAQPR